MHRKFRKKSVDKEKWEAVFANPYISQMDSDESLRFAVVGIIFWQFAVSEQVWFASSEMGLDI